MAAPPVRTRHSTASRSSRLSLAVAPGSEALPGSSGGNLLPSRVAHHKPRPLKHCPNPAKTEREARPVSRGNPQCQQALEENLVYSSDCKPPPYDHPAQKKRVRDILRATFGIG